MNNLIIIGNGFDLAHNMKTSYSHFIEYLVQAHIKSNEYTDLFDFDNDFEDFNDFRKKNFPEFKNSNKGSYHVYVKLKLIKFMLDEYLNGKWCDIEDLYFRLLVGDHDNKYFSMNPKDINEQFDVVKEHLIYYLKIQEKDAVIIESYKRLFNQLNYPSTTILNFNYTNTLMNLYSTEIEECKIIHIHGELSNSKNPIVFGYAASDEESRQLIDKGNNEYMRNIKKHLYKRTENEKLLAMYLNFHKRINISIFGHSCGLSDKLILNKILNHENIESISVFYFEEYEHYFQTQVNIDRIMNRDEHFSKLIVFNSSHRMPQHNDTNKLQDAFIKYITPIIEQRNVNRKLSQIRLNQ